MTMIRRALDALAAWLTDADDQHDVEEDEE